jgi:hypothetical protein
MAVGVAGTETAVTAAVDTETAETAAAADRASEAVPAVLYPYLVTRPVFTAVAREAKD